MKKIISFCLYGDQSKYNLGSLENITLAREIYPDYLCRFYVSKINTDKEIIEKLKQEGAEIVPLDRKGDWTFLNDRFLPISESDVSCCLIRDCDSRLSWREEQCVRIWEKSGFNSLSLHDHCYHRGCPILGGLGAFKSGAIANIGQLIKDYSGIKDSWGNDQSFLTDCVWPLVKDSCLLFDSFYCDYPNSFRFPSLRPADFSFCGEIWENDMKPNPEHRAIIRQVCDGKIIN